MPTALITGASGGIGLELAKIHASKGDNLVLVARTKSKLDQLATDLQAQFGIKAVVIEKDLSKPDAAAQLYQSTRDQNLTIDYLINNAGFGDYGFFAESDLSKQTQMINLNVLALTELSRLYLPDMISRKTGKIMNVASIAAFQPGPLMSVYFASKAYVLSFSQALHNEVASQGISVTTLCPGPTQSSFFENAAMQNSSLIKGKNFPTAAQLAQYGYQAMMRGQSVAVHGLSNNILTSLVGFLPRSLVVRMVRRMQG